MKKILSIFLIIAMLVTTCTVSAARYTDIDGHWAQKEIEAWSDYGVISGYDGKFSPNRFITRGEFAVVLNRLMAYQKESVNIFADLPDKFYTSSVLRLFSAGVMQGYDGYINPEASLTREEASVMICRALGIVTADKMNRNFADEADISSWAKPYINAMVNEGLLNGADGKLNPKNPIMRSEVVKILDNAVNPILKSGTFENVNTGKILVISSGNTTIKNSEIKGKIIITQGVTEGKVSFEDSKIENDIIFDNERDAFVELKNTTVSNESILNDKAFVADNKKESSPSFVGAGWSGGGGSGAGSGGGGSSSGGSGGCVGGSNSGGSTTGGSTTGGVDNEPYRTTIEYSDTEVLLGAEVLMPVSISYNAGVSELQLSVAYDSNVFTLLEVEQGEALGELTFTRPSDFTANPITFCWNGTSIDVADGDILLLTFKVADDASTGDYSFDIELLSVDNDEDTRYVEVIDGTVTVIGEECIAGHTYGDWVSDGMTQHKKVCSCGHAEYQGHRYGIGVITTPATCTQNGVRTFTCTECGYLLSGNIPAFGHTYGEWEQDDDDYHKKECECGDVVREPHVWVRETNSNSSGSSGGASGSRITFSKSYDVVDSSKFEVGDIDSWFDFEVGETVSKPIYFRDQKYRCTVCNATKIESPQIYLIMVSGPNRLSVTSGNEITIPIHISNDNIGLTDLTLQFTYNKKVFSYLGAEQGEALGSLQLTKPDSQFETGNITFRWSGTEDDSSSGEILLLKFKVAESTSTGDYIISGICKNAYGAGMKVVHVIDNLSTRVNVTEHEHPYGDWVTDGDTYHKKECSCGDVVREAHNWDAGVVTQEPTVTEEGVLTYTCSECNETKTEEIKKLPDPATTTTITVEDISAEQGEEITVPVIISNNNVGLTGLTLNLTYDPNVLAYLDATQGEALDSMDFTKPGPAFTEGSIIFLWDSIDSDFSNGEILQVSFRVKDTADVGAHSMDVNVITACDFDMEDIETIENGATILVSQFTNQHTYGDWVTDGDTYHKKECSCGDVVREAHNWDAGVVTQEPTITEEGVLTYTCSECNETKTEEIKKLPDPATTTTITVGDISVEQGEEITVPVIISNNNVGLTGLTLNLTYDPNVLAYLDATQGEALDSMDFTKPGPAFTEGSIIFLWDSIDSDFSNGEIVQVTFRVKDTADVGAHSINANVVNACDFDIEDVETIVVAGTITVEHKYDDWVTADDDYHKKECLCGDIVREAHSWDAGVITQEPTVTEEGILTYNCSVCNHSKTEVMEKLPDSNALAVIVGNISAKTGEEITVPVSITNNIGLTGLELSIRYNSDVLTLTGYENGEALRGLTFTKPGNTLANPIKFLWDGTDADATNGSILLLKFLVADGADSGEYFVDVTVNSACDADVNDVEIPSIDGKISVEGTI